LKLFNIFLLIRDLRGEFWIFFYKTINSDNRQWMERIFITADL